VFAWGCLVVFAASGRNPFGQGSFQVLAARAVHAEPEIGALPPALAGLVGAALSKDPGRRPGARDLLLGLVGGVGEAAVTTELGESWTSPPAEHAGDPGVTSRDAPARPPAPAPVTAPAPPRPPERPAPEPRPEPPAEPPVEQRAEPPVEQRAEPPVGRRTELQTEAPTEPPADAPTERGFGAPPPGTPGGTGSRRRPSRRTAVIASALAGVLAAGA